MKTDNKKKKFIVFLCIIAVLVILFSLFVENINNKDAGSSVVNSADVNSTTIAELESIDGGNEQTTYREESPYVDEFHCEGLPAEILPFIENDIEGMTKAMQETLYASGCYDYKKATFFDLVKIDYSIGTVEIYFKVKCNKNLIISAIYNNNDKSWLIKYW